MCGNLLNIKEELYILKDFDYLHIDIMDGHFVPNIALGFDLIKKIKEYTPIPLNIHLMMDYPSLALNNLNISKEDSVVFHIECKDDLYKIIKSVREKKGKVGIAINPSTPLKKIYPFLKNLDHVLVMTVYPGFAGRPFIPSSYERVEKLSAKIKENYPHITIGVDGAIGFEQIKVFNQLGVNLFVVGTTVLFKKNLSKQANILTSFICQLEKTSMDGKVDI